MTRTQQSYPYVLLKMAGYGTTSFSQSRAYFDGSDLIVADIEGHNQSRWPLGSWREVQTFDGMGNETAHYLPRDAEAHAQRETAVAS